MGWTAITAASGQRVSPQETKLCALCGALNYYKNVECCTCGWSGVFEMGTPQTQLAWQRLFDEFEDVRIEHVTARRRPQLELGVTGRPSAWAQARRAVVRWWRSLWSLPSAGAIAQERPQTNSATEGR